MTVKLVWLKIAVVLIALSGCSAAFAQCSASIPGGTLCGNRTSSQGLNGPLTNPILGIPGSSTGQMGFAGLTSGTATIAAQSAAGAPTLLLPTASGTLASTAASPIVLNATTGQLTCPTCLTGSGGTLTATAPLNITGNNISLQGGNGTIAQGSGGTGSSFTATPSLGVPGATSRSLTFANLTSGFVEFVPQSGALGASVLTIPAITDTLAGKALANGGTNAALTASNGGIVWSNSTQLQILSGTATARQMLQSGANATPAWSTATWPATTTINQILFSSAANTVTGLATANNGVLVTSSGGVPSISTTLPAGLSIGNVTLSGTLTAPALSTSGAIAGSLCQTSGGLVLFESGVNCFAVAASSVAVGSTTVTSGTSPFCLNDNAGTLGNVNCARLDLADQTMTGGANVTSQSLTTGSVTIDCGSRPLQFITGNSSAWTITAPSNDGSCLLLITNNATTSTVPTFSGFTTGANTGDAFDTTASHKFMVSIARINGTATWVNKALQ